MDNITLIFDVVLPVLHEVLQCYQWVFDHWHHIFRGPGIHGNQHDPRVQLFLVDLGTKNARQSTALLAWHLCCEYCTWRAERYLGWIMSKCGNEHTHILSDRWRCVYADFSGRRIIILQTKLLPHLPCWPLLWQSSWFGCLSDAAVQTVERQRYTDGVRDGSHSYKHGDTRLYLYTCKDPHQYRV